MSSLKDVFAVLQQMRDHGLVSAYAIGGATAVLFYAEPTRTYDVDVFVTLPSNTPAAIVSLAPVYAWARTRGIATEGEHLLIEGVPVQLLPAYNALVEKPWSRPVCTTTRVSPCGWWVQNTWWRWRCRRAVRGALSARGSCFSLAAWTAGACG